MMAPFDAVFQGPVLVERLRPALVPPTTSTTCTSAADPPPPARAAYGRGPAALRGRSGPTFGNSYPYGAHAEPLRPGGWMSAGGRDHRAGCNTGCPILAGSVCCGDEKCKAMMAAGSRDPTTMTAIADSTSALRAGRHRCLQ